MDGTAESLQFRDWPRIRRSGCGLRPATDGSVEFKNLPAGDYLVAALTDVEEGQWFDPAFLSQLIPHAVKVTVVDGERRVQDIRIAK